MNNMTLSEALERIKNATDTIRESTYTSEDSIEDVAGVVCTMQDTIDNLQNQLDSYIISETVPVIYYDYHNDYTDKEECEVELTRYGLIFKINITKQNTKIDDIGFHISFLDSSDNVFYEEDRFCDLRDISVGNTVCLEVNITALTLVQVDMIKKIIINPAYANEEGRLSDFYPMSWTNATSASGPNVAFGCYSKDANNTDNYYVYTYALNNSYVANAFYVVDEDFDPSLGIPNGIVPMFFMPSQSALVGRFCTDKLQSTLCQTYYIPYEVSPSGGIERDTIQVNDPYINNINDKDCVGIYNSLGFWYNSTSIYNNNSESIICNLVACYEDGTTEELYSMVVNPYSYNYFSVSQIDPDILDNITDFSIEVDWEE